MKNLVSLQFEGSALRVVDVDGRKMVIARDIGRALNYSADGKRLVDNITEKWAGEFKTGEHYEIRDMDEVGTGSVPTSKFMPRAMLLTEEGVNLVLLNTRKSIGTRLRRFLAADIMPRLARGETIHGSAPASAPSTVDPRVMKEMRLAEREKRLAAVEDRKQREQKARGYMMQYDAVASVNPPSPQMGAAFRKFIGSVLAGGDLAEAAGQRALPAPDMPMDLTIVESAHYMSVTDGAAEIGTNRNVYGRIVKRLCIADGVDYLAGVDGLTRAKVGMTKTTEAGFQMPVAQYEVTPAMNAKVAVVMEADRREAAAVVAEVERRKSEREAAAATKRAENERIRAEREARRKSSAPSLPFNAPIKGKGECA